jgi:triacylglycerol esterase/lipase EstA (alpha/beta hydrolase family)
MRRVSDGQHEERRDDDAVRDAVGKLRKALETTERARGRLYDFHQMTGTADFELGDAVRALRAAGLDREAELVETELIGRNVIGDRWTFQIVEDYDDGYYASFHRIERQVRAEAGDVPRHGYEQQLKDARRTRGRPGHAPGRPSS